MQQLFIRADYGLPAVDVPDWRLVEQIVDLFRPYTEPVGSFACSIQVEDSRGNYSGDLAEIREAMDRRGELPVEIRIDVDGLEDADRLRRSFSVGLREDGSDVAFTSGDEAIVILLLERSMRLIGQAAERREQRLDADKTASGWKKLLHNPNPWVLAVGAAVIGGVIVGLIFAIR
jgi:hypothetical protein